MTKWMGWPEASEHGGHMIKRVSDPSVKVTDDFICQDCGTRGDALVFTVGLRGCPKRPASLNYLTIRDFKGVESMTLDEQKAAAREHWLDFAKRVGMQVIMETESISREGRPELVMLFTSNTVIYELVYNEKLHSMAVHAVGKHSRMQAAE